MTVTIDTKGLEVFARYVAQLPRVTKRAARIAINQVADLSLKKMIPGAMRKEIAFPPGYLEDGEKLYVRDRAQDDRLLATIYARDRPTSLARFSLAGSPGIRLPGGIPVQVTPGRTIDLKRAFMVRLRSGASLTADNFNIGLAIRLPAGQRPRHKHTFAAQRFDDGVFLLYAPSVNQVFATVADDLSPELGEQVESEFFRQFLRLQDEDI